MDDFRGRISQSIYMKNLPLNSKGGSQQNCFRIYDPASVSLLFPWRGGGRKVKYPQSGSGLALLARPSSSSAVGPITLSCPCPFLWCSPSSPGLTKIPFMALGPTLPWPEALGDANLLSTMVFLPQSCSQEKIICTGTLGMRMGKCHLSLTPWIFTFFKFFPRPQATRLVFHSSTGEIQQQLKETS